MFHFVKENFTNWSAVLSFDVRNWLIDQSLTLSLAILFTYGFQKFISNVNVLTFEM